MVKGDDKSLIKQCVMDLMPLYVEFKIPDSCFGFTAHCSVSGIKKPDEVTVHYCSDTKQQTDKASTCW